MSETLATLEKGARALVLGFAEDDEDSLRKLLALGLAPGDRLRVVAAWPACLFELGSASYALDRELAGKIFVQRDPRPIA